MKAAAVLALMLAACSPEARQDAAPHQADPSTPEAAREPAGEPGEPLPDTAALAGEWRVAGVDGRDVDQSEAITASIADGRITASAGCVLWRWRYTLADGAMTTQAEAMPVPPCARGLTRSESDFAKAMDNAATARRLPSRGVMIAGSAGTVLLFSQ